MDEYTFIYNKREVKLINKLINKPPVDRHWWDEFDDEDHDPFFKKSDDESCVCGLTYSHGELRFFVGYSMLGTRMVTRFYDNVPDEVTDSGITIKIIKED